MRLVATLGVSHVEAWRLPLGYAFGMVDAADAAESAPAAAATGGANATPVVTADGIELPPGMAAIARMMRGG